MSLTVERVRSMIELFFPAICVGVAMVGASFAAHGTLFEKSNPGGTPDPAQRGPMIVGWLLLTGAGLGLFLYSDPDRIAIVQKSPIFHVTTWAVIGLALILIGGFLTAIGNFKDNMSGEVAGCLLWIAGILMVSYAWINPDWHRTIRAGVFPPMVAVNGANPGPVTAQATGPGGSATATVQPPAVATTTPPAPAVTPPAPVVASKPLSTSDPARVSKVTWKASNPKEVVFDPLEPDRQWAIMHEDLDADPAFANGVIVKKNTYTFGGKDLKKVRVYEVDVTDPANKVAISKITDVPLQ